MSDEMRTEDLLIAEFEARKARGEVVSNEVLNQRTWQGIRRKLSKRIPALQLAAAFVAVIFGWSLLARLQDANDLREKGGKPLDAVSAAPFSYVQGKIIFNASESTDKLLFIRPLPSGDWSAIDLTADQPFSTMKPGDYVACGFATKGDLAGSTQLLLADPLAIESRGACAKVKF